MESGKSYKAYLHLTDAVSYIAALDRLAATFVEKNKREKYELIPFIVTCAAGLECLLNDTIINHVSFVFGPEGYKRFADPLLAIPLRGKLNYILPLISESKFFLKEKSPTYQNLASLISIRNKLMHNKSHYIEVDLEQKEDGTYGIQVPAKVTMLGKVKVTFTECNRFLDALKDLQKILSADSKWEEHEAVAKNEENNGVA